LLNMEGMGFSRSEITKELTSLFRCTPRAVQYDFKNRGKWQPVMDKFDPQTSMLKITNRYKTIYRKASFMFLQSKREEIQLGALRIMIESTKALREVILPNIREGEVKPDKIEISFANRCMKCGENIEDNNRLG